MKADAPSSFLGMSTIGLDGTKLSEAQGRIGEDKGQPGDQDIVNASITGDRNTLKADAYIPLTMAAIYLGILLYFKSKGGYKVVSIDDNE